ncbi:FG-GAP-like repeat-containing protein [Streptomyces collinus]|uniref:FG-GAP-like repeat-containing protein n=1 Tax=Streptomyces collinus TaxID=42684 RepID=UPI003645ACDC
MFSVRSHARWAVPLVLGMASLGVVVPPASASGAAAPVRDDFNGDGYADLAVGAPHGTVGGQAQAGYVTVMYGGPHGLSTGHRTIISRSTGGVPGDPAKNQRFGLQLSKGDLDGDGYADLVIGTGSSTAGAVVVWGGAHGLTGGTSIAATDTQTGDFDGDGHLDLAVFRAGFAAGDDPIGTTAALWKGPLKRSGAAAAKTPFDHAHLQYIDIHDGATGDINRDGRSDLVLTGYCGDGSYCSRVYVSGPSGLAQPADWYPSGDSAALGDVDGDGYADLVTGFSDDNSVTVVPGTASGLGAQGTWTSYTQDTPGVPGAREEEDSFGASVSVADVTGDGIADVAIGAPGENGAEGVVDVLRGSRTGLTGAGAQAFTQDTRGVPGAAEAGDGFGQTVKLLDLDRDHHADLAVDATNEDRGNGTVWVLRGRSTGVTTDAALAFGGKAVGAPYTKAAFGFELK